MMEISYKEYRAVQAPNNHVIISIGGRVIAHAQCACKMSEEELKEAVEEILALRERGQA